MTGRGRYLPVLLACAAFHAAQGETISGVSLVQQWPWSEAVSIDFTVSGWSGPKFSVREISVAAYDGEEEIGFVSPCALSGDTVIDGDGAKHIVLTPSKDASLKARGRIDRFKVALSSRKVADEDVLYVVFDLSKEAGARGARQYVTRRDLTNGVWGAWAKSDELWRGVDAGEGPADNVVWTGLADDERYFRDLMAFRRIPAGSFTMGAGGYKGRDKRPARAAKVAISNPYYIAVFETTKYQFRILKDGKNMNTPDVMLPSVNDSCSTIRGDSAPGGEYDWPAKRGVDPKSIAGRLGARTGLAGMFDLPSEAQWEKAARGGVPGGTAYWDGATDANEDGADAICWYGGNAGGILHRGGLKKPNQYGLYDVLGNAYEMVLDWQNGGIALASADPVGETCPSPGYPQRRMLKGGKYTNSLGECTLYWRSQNPVVLPSRDGGCGSRFVLNIAPYGIGDLALAAKNVKSNQQEGKETP